SFDLIRVICGSHSSFWCNGDAKELRVPSCPASILNAVHHAIFSFTGVRTFLTWSLVWTDADLFIFLGTGVPEVELIRDITTDRDAFRIEQCNSICSRRVEPIVRLSKHLRHEELHSRCACKRKLV